MNKRRKTRQRGADFPTGVELADDITALFTDYNYNDSPNKHRTQAPENTHWQP